MGRPRSIDYEQARALRRQGLSYREIGLRLGVSHNTAQRACDPAFNRRQQKLAARWSEERREPCRGGCGVLVSYRGLKDTTGYCQVCWNDRRRFEAEMRDNHGTESRYNNLGCRCLACRHAMSDARRRRSHASRVPCSHGCGRMVDPYNRRYPGKPPECRPCFQQRQAAERSQKKAAA